MGLPKIALPGCHGDRHASIYSSVFSCLLLFLLLCLTTHKATGEGCINFCEGSFFVVGILGLFSLHWACLCCESHSVVYGDWPGRRFVHCFVWVFIRSIWTGLLPSSASKAAWYLYWYIKDLDTFTPYMINFKHYVTCHPETIMHDSIRVCGFSTCFFNASQLETFRLHAWVLTVCLDNQDIFVCACVFCLSWHNRCDILQQILDAAKWSWQRFLYCLHR